MRGGIWRYRHILEILMRWTLGKHLPGSLVGTQQVQDELLLLLRSKWALIKILVLFPQYLFLIDLKQLWLVYDLRGHEVSLGCMGQSLGIVRGVLVLHVWELIISRYSLLALLSRNDSLLLIHELSHTVTTLQPLPLVVLVGVVAGPHKILIHMVSLHLVDKCACLVDHGWTDRFCYLRLGSQ